MTDQTKAVAALAEAISTWRCSMDSRPLADAILEYIAANTELLREYGIGRLPTRSELESIWDDDAFVGVRISEMIRLGWAIEDPDPQPPEPTLREQVAAMIQAGMDNGQYPDAIMRSLFAEFDITPKAPRP